MLPDKNQIRTYKRHKRIWRFARIVLGPPILHFFRCKSKIAGDLPEPYIVLSNHCCDLDPAIVGVSFPHQMYFVASEHVYRKGLISKILLYTFAPIAKIKGASDKMMVLNVLKAIREKKNVCIFPEGDRTFNGKTGEIADAIGKLVKISGANLVTYKISGGYFANPRWGYGIRKGKMSGAIENIYTKEMLSNETPEQITSIIRKDLYENAYERQKLEHIKFKGKKLAEGMECALTVCPVCKKINVIKTKDNLILCDSCGTLAKYNEYGLFEKQQEAFTFETVEQWDTWQDNFFESLVSSSSKDSEPYFSDAEVKLSVVGADHSQKDLGNGVIALSYSGLSFKSSVTNLFISIEDLPDMAMYGKKGLVFTDEKNIHYELQSDKLLNVRKYVSIWRLLRKTVKEME